MALSEAAISGLAKWPYSLAIKFDTHTFHLYSTLSFLFFRLLVSERSLHFHPKLFPDAFNLKALQRDSRPNGSVCLVASVALPSSHSIFRYKSDRYSLCHYNVTKTTAALWKRPGILLKHSVALKTQERYFQERINL